MTAAELHLALWYVGRGAGVVTLVLLTLTLVLGVVTRAGRPLPGLPRFAVAGLHRSTSLLAGSLLAVHVVTLTLDPDAQLRWLATVVPFASAWRPLWVGLGALGCDLVLALIVTSLLRPRIGRRTWRLVHWAAYAAWPLAVLHSLGTGTDAAGLWFRALLCGCLAVVAAAVAWRTSAGFLDPAGRVPGSRRPALPPRDPDPDPTAVLFR